MQQKIEGSAAIVNAINQFHTDGKLWRFGKDKAGTVLAKLVEGGFLIEITKPAYKRRFQCVSCLYQVMESANRPLFAVILQRDGKVLIELHETVERDKTTFDEASVYDDVNFVTLEMV